MFKKFLPSLRKQSLATRRPTSISDLMEEFWKEPFGSFPAFPFLKNAASPFQPQSASNEPGLSIFAPGKQSTNRKAKR